MKSKLYILIYSTIFIYKKTWVCNYENMQYTLKLNIRIPLIVQIYYVLQSSKAKVVAFPGFWRMAACCVNRLILYIVSKVLQTGLFVSRLQVVYYHLAQLCTLLRRSERTNPIDFRSIDCISFKICNRQRRQKENHPKPSKFC